jgi:glycosyltransferase involved in cell wall biosynthesis
MKLLAVHNYYQQAGGEDAVFEAETQLMEDHGHRVIRYTAHNDQVWQLSAPRLAGKTIWNAAVHHDLVRLLKQERPDIVHVHNTLPLISPSVYYAARTVGVPVVQTLHNYRLLCPSALLFRDGHLCEDCLHRAVPTPGVRHRCYRGSRSASAAVAAMLTIHRAIGTWRRDVDRFIALTEFAREKFVAGGLAPEKIMVKPNFTRDPETRAGGGTYALFVGRLSPEKGYRVLLESWPRLAARIPLVVIGDGPGTDEVACAAAQAQAGVQLLGRRSAAEVRSAMAAARFLVFPSLWYETFGLTIIEAYAVGIPVIASKLGAMSTLVQHGHTGLHFRPGDPDDLVRQVEWALAHPAEMDQMGKNARLTYEAHYTPERNYAMLMDVYKLAGSDRRVIDDRRDRASPADCSPGETPDLVAPLQSQS